MSRSSLIIGLLAAGALHALLFAPALWSSEQPDPADPSEDPPAVAITPPPEPAPTPEPEPVKQPTPEPKPRPEPVKKPTPPLREVHKQPAAQDPPPRQGNTHNNPVEEADPSDLPPLRIIWDSPSELRRIAARLGMRIVAVNSGGEILGEVPSAGAVRLVEFGGQLSRYSNRVRTLPVSFFGHQLARQAETAARLWVLVPTGVDRRWIHMQKQAIARAGVDLTGVRELEGEFRRARGTVRLVVTRIKQSVN
jgi:hypothetical protein